MKQSALGWQWLGERGAERKLTMTQGGVSASGRVGGDRIASPLALSEGITKQCGARCLKSTGTRWLGYTTDMGKKTRTQAPVTTISRSLHNLSWKLLLNVEAC